MKSQGLCIALAVLLLAGCSRPSVKDGDQASDGLSTRPSDIQDSNQGSGGPAIQPSIARDSGQAPGKHTTQPSIIITGSENELTFPGDQASITSMKIDGDTLRLTVTHGGGCADHTYQLYTSGAVMKSYPPQMNIRLSHNANGDACEALITKDLAFDLSPLKKQLGGSSGTVVLHIYEPGAQTPREPALRYNY